MLLGGALCRGEYLPWNENVTHQQQRGCGQQLVSCHTMNFYLHLSNCLSLFVKAKMDKFVCHSKLETSTIQVLSLFKPFNELPINLSS